MLVFGPIEGASPDLGDLEIIYPKKNVLEPRIIPVQSTTRAKEGIKIVVGLMPVFALAAFIEGFVTRHYRMPALLSGALLLASGVFIIWYFILYPIRLQQKRKSEVGT